MRNMISPHFIQRLKTIISFGWPCFFFTVDRLYLCISGCFVPFGTLFRDWAKLFFFHKKKIKVLSAMFFFFWMSHLLTQALFLSHTQHSFSGSIQQDSEWFCVGQGWKNGKLFHWPNKLQLFTELRNNKWNLTVRVWSHHITANAPKLWCCRQSEFRSFHLLHISRLWSRRPSLATFAPCVLSQRALLRVYRNSFCRNDTEKLRSVRHEVWGPATLDATPEAKQIRTRRSFWNSPVHTAR